jgi:hypothetical protein
LDAVPVRACMNSTYHPTSQALQLCLERSEAMIMVCIQVIGNDTAVAIAGSQGNFGWSLKVRWREQSRPEHV